MRVVKKPRTPTPFEQRLYEGMRRNPFAPTVPCHRVISSNRCLGGFNGDWGDQSEKVQRKRQMLIDEGVKFEAGGKVQSCCVLGVEDLLARRS